MGKSVLWRCHPEESGLRAHMPESVRNDLLPFARFVVFPRGMEALHAECDMTSKPPACLRPLPTAEVAESYARRYPGSLADEEARLQELRSTRSLAEPYLRIRRDERRCLESLLAEVQGLIAGSQNEAPASQPESSSHFVDRHEEKRERQTRKDSE